MGRHVTVNRLEVPQITRSALNNTYRCQASNTKLVAPVERSIRIEMLREYCDRRVHFIYILLNVCINPVHFSKTHISQFDQQVEGILVEHTI